MFQLKRAHQCLTTTSINTPPNTGLPSHHEIESTLSKQYSDLLCTAQYQHRNIVALAHARL